MKRTLESIISASVLAICLTGCQKEIFSSFSEIRFKAGTVPASQTKTEYGSRVGSTQMVDWRTGDLIRISCEAAALDQIGDPVHFADYSVQSDGSRDGTSARSISTIAPHSKGLHWGSEDDTHIFYSVYPSPATPGKSSDSLDEEGNMCGNIPEVQSPLSVSSSSPYVAAPNMIHQYMVAKTTVPAGKQIISEDEVFLNYTPVTTAIQFGVKNKMESSLAIRSIEISSGSKNLSGTFTASLKTLNESGVYSSGSYPAFTASSGAKKTASVSFGDSGLTLAVDDSLTFTVFLLPESDLNDLTFRINKVGGGYIQTALKRDASTWISFDRCKKHFVNGLFVNEGAKWTVCFAPGVSSWIENVDDRNLDDPEAYGIPSLVSWDLSGESGELNLGKPVEYKFSLATGVSDTQTFNPAASDWNVKTLGISSTKDSESEGWVNEPQGWKIKTVGGKAVTGNSYTTSDGLLTVEKDGNNLKVTDNRQKVSYGDNAHWTTSGTDWYRAPLSGTIDLSKRDFRTGDAISMTTANCYVVRNAGTYKIPLVYGNAVVNGNSNSDSYAPTIASGGSNGLTPFVNHLGNGIFDPYIENNTVDGDAKWYTAPEYNGSGKIKTPEAYNRFLVASSAKVLWQDNGEVVKNVSLGTAVSGHDSNTGNPVMCDIDHVRYIEFSISQDDIRQCNAVIAVYDGANGTGNILWSWHIWITNNPDLGQQAIAVTNNAGKTSSFLAAPAIGWIDPDFYEKNNDVKIVLEQEESGEQITVTTKHPEYTYYGHGSCYQFGRKDPMRYNVTTDTNAATTVEIKTSILNPGTFYTKWIGLDKYNLWTGKESKKYSLIELLGSNTYAEEGSDKIKTIYDPSPAGYKVPSVKAFTGFTKDGKKCGGSEGSYQLTDSNVSGSYHHGWDFYTNSSHTSTIYFPSAYCRISTGDQGSGGIGRYRTSTANSDSDDGSFEFQFQSTYVYPMTEKSSKANALPIRPITE